MKEGDRAIAHIGIVGCSAEGAALCYRTICAEGAALLGPHDHPEITIHTPPLRKYVRCLDSGDLNGVAALMLGSARKLRDSGADFLICPDNTIHQAMHLVLPKSPLPWLHIANIVAGEAAARGYRNVGILGTHWLTSSSVYPEALAVFGIACERPRPHEAEELGRIIMDELVPGRVEQGSVGRLEEIVDEMKARGCDAVVLGCTELPLVLADANCSLPTLDSTRLLARAALRTAVAG